MLKTGACETEVQNASTVWPGERAPAQIGDRAGNQDRHLAGRDARSSKTSAMAKSAALELSVSKIVSTSSTSTPPSSKRMHLLAVGLLHLVERHLALRGIIHVARDRERFAHRPDGPGHEGLPAAFLHRAPRAGRRGEVQIADDRLQPVIRLRDGLGVKRVRLDDIRAGRQVVARGFPR